MVLDNPITVQQHEAIFEVLAAFVGNNNSDDFVTT